MKQHLIEMHKDYMAHYTSPEEYADDHGMTPPEVLILLNLGKQFYERAKK